MHHDVTKITAHLFRENAGKMHAVLTQTFGAKNFELVLDAVQDAFEAALIQWRYGGIPDNPSGWLMQVAKRKAINFVKRESRVETLTIHEATIDESSEEIWATHDVEDSELRLMLACAHPSLSERKQVAFTLHVLCGFGVHEIASALLMEYEAVKKMLFRLRSEFTSLMNENLFANTAASEERMHTAHAVLYLMFNEGYKTTKAASSLDYDLCYEAIRLTKLLSRSTTPLNDETNALLALMFFNLSRFPSRVDENGCSIPLEKQDRNNWNKAFIEEGYKCLNASLPESLNRYYVEALIASLHCAAPDYLSTDWQKLLYLYSELEQLVPTTTVRLNRIVALSYFESPHSALVELHRLRAANCLDEDSTFYATLADIHRRCKNVEDARSAYVEAKRLASSPVDKLFFEICIQLHSSPVNN